MKDSLHQLERREYELLSALAGETPVATKLSGVELARERLRLLALITEQGVGSGTVDASPPPEDTEAPPLEEGDPEPEVIEPIILAEDSYVPDLTSYSPYNRPRLSAVGTDDYFPAAATGIPGAARYFGLKLAPSETWSFRRIEVPFRRPNVQGGELFGLLILKKVSNSYVVVASRFTTLVARQARMWWDKTLTVPAGEEWAVIVGTNNGNSNIFYGDVTPYAAPYAGAGIGLDEALPSTVGRVWTLTEAAASHRLIRLYGVNLAKDVVGPLEAIDLPAGVPKVEEPMTQAAYDALVTKEANTFYVISDA